MTTAGALELIDRWLARALADAPAAWLQRQQAAIATPPAGGDGARALFLAFSAAARQVAGLPPPALEANDLAQAEAVLPGWRPQAWSLATLLRIRLLLALPDQPAERWLATLDRLYATAGLDELVALYQALPVLPHPERLRVRASEGLRSSIQDVFAAVALDNPYPAAWLAPLAWNQLVMKALFTGAPLERVIGVAGRCTPELTRMVSDFVHERWAASRPVPAACWWLLCLQPDAGALADLERAAASPQEEERAAARAALQEARRLAR
jgi:hypothetical protein